MLYPNKWLRRRYSITICSANF